MPAFYKLFIPGQSTATASTVMFDLFNVAGSGLNIDVHHVCPQSAGDVALTGTLAPNLHLFKSTAVGTGGTAATVEGTSYSAMTISAYGHTQPINLDKVSARLTPTGGATSGGVLSWVCQFTEESNVATYVERDLVRRGNNAIPPLRLRPGTGIKVVQGSIGTSGTVGFDVLFSTSPNAT